jgi:hypothetical protein
MFGGKILSDICSFNLRISLCPVALRPNADLDVLILDSLDHIQRQQQSVGFLLTSDQLVVKTST